MATVTPTSTVKPERVSVLILAAGSGDRLGSRPKAFLRLDGQTLLERAVAVVSPFATEVIRVPAVPTLLAPLVTVVPLQVFACELATAKGLDVDQPRNLAKSVTVE